MTKNPLSTLWAMFCVVTLLPMFVAACVATPQSPAQSIAAGYGTVAAVRATAADLLVAKTISVDDARMVQGLADQARAALDLARGFDLAGKPLDAAHSLELAVAVLTRVQNYLKIKGP